MGKIIAEIEQNRKELKEFNENIASGLANYLSSVKSVLGECVDDLLQNQKIDQQVCFLSSHLPFGKILVSLRIIYIRAEGTP